MNRPNAFHRLLHAIGATRPVNAFFSTRLHRMDKFILKLTKNKHTLSELLGWNIIQLTTTGAKSGDPRTMPLIASFDGAKIILIASSFGREHNPGWYYNLKAHPDCTVTFRGETHTYTARETDGDEREHCWRIALESYAGYDVYKQRASHRKIPVMLLERIA